MNEIHESGMTRLTEQVGDLKLSFATLSIDIKNHMEASAKAQEEMNKRTYRHSVELYGDGTDSSPGQKLKVDRLIESEKLRTESDKNNRAILGGVIIAVIVLIIQALWKLGAGIFNHS